MKASFSSYDFAKSRERIDEILDSKDTNYEDKDSIPSRDLLTFENGFYVSAAAMFIDMRGSNALADKHKRPTLAKMYRSFISELIAVLKGNANVDEICIEGDCVWGVFNTPFKKDIDGVFSTAARAASLVDVLSYKYKKKGYSEIEVGIGISYGTTLLIKAGYKGSGINEVVWLGKLVNDAAKLSSYGNRLSSDREMMISNLFYENLNDGNKEMFVKNTSRDCYHANVVNSEMNDWLKEQK